MDRARSSRLQKVDLVDPTMGVVTTEALLDRIDEDTSLVAVSEVQSSNGHRVDLMAISERCKQ